MKWDCGEDADKATGAESSIDEGEDAEPGEVHSEPHPPSLPNKNPVWNRIQYIIKLQLYRIMNNLLFVLQISLLLVFLCI